MMSKAILCSRRLVALLPSACVSSNLRACVSRPGCVAPRPGPISWSAWVSEAGMSRGLFCQAGPHLKDGSHHRRPHRMNPPGAYGYWNDCMSGISEAIASSTYSAALWARPPELFFDGSCGWLPRRVRHKLWSSDFMITRAFLPKRRCILTNNADLLFAHSGIQIAWLYCRGALAEMPETTCEGRMRPNEIVVRLEPRVSRRAETGADGRLDRSHHRWVICHPMGAGCPGPSSWIRYGLRPPHRLCSGT